MIQCETFIFNPSNNGIVNFAYKMNLDEELMKQSAKDVAKDCSKGAPNEPGVEEFEEEEEYYFDDTISDEDFEAKLHAYYASKSVKSDLSKSVTWAPQLATVLDNHVGVGVSVPGVNNVSLPSASPAYPASSLSSSASKHPLVPEIKSFTMEEMTKRGYKKIVHPMAALTM